MTATDTTVLLFWVKNPSAVRRLFTALACVDPLGRRDAGPGSILHKHDECCRSSHTTVAFSWKNHSLETVQAKKEKKKKKKKKKKKRTCSLAMPQQPLHWTWSNMKQEWGRFEEQKSLPTNPRKSFHLKWAQRSFARIFLPTMADINFPRTLAQGVCRWVLFQHWTTPFSYTIAKALLYLQKKNYISWLVLNFLKLATTFRKIVFGNWWLFAIHFSSFVLSLSLFFFYV